MSICVLMVLLFNGAGCGSSSSGEMVLAGIDLGEMLDGLLKRTMRTLSTVKDESSAQAAVMELTAINSDIDDLIYHAPKLSPAGQAELSAKVAETLPTVQETTQYINSIRGLTNILGPVMEDMVHKLTTLMAVGGPPPLKNEDVG